MRDGQGMIRDEERQEDGGKGRPTKESGKGRKKK
jgi:hypothetical protein